LIWKALSILIYTMLYGAFAHGQAPYTLQLVSGRDSSLLRDIYEVETSFPNPELRQQGLRRLLNTLHSEAYLLATIDSLVRDSLHLKAYLTLGDQYQVARLKNGNIEEDVLSQIGFRERIFLNKPFRLREIRRLHERLLEYAENSGYPFATVKLDSFHIQGNQISASIFLIRNQQIELDSIIVHGEARITNTYLYNYLGLKPHGIYDESVITKISGRIKELPFLEEEQPLKVVFITDKARLHLFLKHKRASRFNFIIGFLPNPNLDVVPAPKSKFLITGDAQLHLHNPMGAGEAFKLDWRRYQQNTSDLKINFLYPYLPLGMPFGADFDLQIYRQDTIFLEVTLGVGLQYQFVGGNYIKAFYQNKVSTLISINKPVIISTMQLPKHIDVEHNLYGLEYHLERLDYKLNPRRGIFFEFNGGLGEKRIKKNNEILALTAPNDPGFDFATLYDEKPLKSIQYRITYTFDKFWKLGTRTALKSGISGGVFISQNIFQNELFRIGGSKILRGFDEESILASQFHILTLEYRFLLDQNSYFYLFTDAAYLENPTRESNPFNDTPIGFGTGITFETKAGIFALSYALGRQLDNPIDFRSAKIHFGYLNYF